MTEEQKKTELDVASTIFSEKISCHVHRLDYWDAPCFSELPVCKRLRVLEYDLFNDPLNEKRTECRCYGCTKLRFYRM